jgi:hypothetical protein
MGVAVWLVAGGAAFFVARIVPSGRRAAVEAVEAVAAIVAAAGAGLAATALDFGGWNEPDWRAGLFVFCCAAAAIGVIRLIRLAG